MSFYPTYEELKFVWNLLPGKVFMLFLPYLWGIEMRKFFVSQVEIHKFLPYLWGIEILFTTFLNKPAFLFLPYLWGIEIVSERGKAFHWVVVFTLPMRNWNYGTRLVLLRVIVSFYPTYEELKLSDFYHAKIDFFSFYPTYEELKLQCYRRQKLSNLCFYPTYEELKF